MEKKSNMPSKQSRPTICKPNVFDRLKFVEPVKNDSKKGRVFDRLHFPSMDEKHIPEGKKQVVEINIENGVSFLRITL